MSAGKARTLHSTCRLCMGTNSSMHDIFSHDPLDEQGSIATRVIWLTQLQMSIGDGLPSKACSRCVVQLDAALDFINQCLYSDKSLRGIEVNNHFAPGNETITSDKKIDDGEESLVKVETLEMDEGLHEEESFDMNEQDPFEDNDFHQTDMCTTLLEDEAPETTTEIKAVQEQETSTSKPKTKAQLKCKESTPPPVPENWFECEFCSRSFAKKMSLASHLKKHTRTTQLKEYKCIECDLTFINKVELGVHAVRHTGIKPFPCLSCEKSFSRRDSLRKHTRIHTKERPYKCTMCENTYSQKWTLRLHERRHIGFAPHKCDHCPRSFCDPSNLKSHASRAHGIGKVKKYATKKK